MSATNRGSTRSYQDFYPTPLESFLPLLKYLDKNLTYWEPACGDRRLIDSLIQNNFKYKGIIHL